MNKNTKFETSIDMEAIRTRLTRMRTDRKITPKVMCDMLSEHMDNPISENSLRKYENGCETAIFLSELWLLIQSVLDAQWILLSLGK